MKPQEQKFMLQFWDRISKNWPQCSASELSVAYWVGRKKQSLQSNQLFKDQKNMLSLQGHITALWPLLRILAPKLKLDFSSCILFIFSIQEILKQSERMNRVESNRQFYFSLFRKKKMQFRCVCVVLVDILSRIL